MSLLPSWVGTRVTSAEGLPLGRVVDVIFDPCYGRPQTLVLQTRDGLAEVPYAGVRQGARAAALAPGAHAVPVVLAA